MILTTPDWIVIIVFLGIIFAVGLRFKNQAGKSIEDFFLGGRNLPWWIAGTSMVATTFAADTPLAVTELVAKNGIAGNWLWWNMLAGGLLTTFFFAKLWRRANVMTDVELIEIRYSGKAAKILRGFRALYLGIFMNCLIIGWVNLALVSILEVFFGLNNYDALAYTALVMLFVMIYSSVSGLMGIAITDVIQFALAMTGCIILAFLVVNSDKIGGISKLKEALPASTFSFFPTIQTGEASQTGKALALGLGSFLAYISVQWWASWYPGAEPGGGGYVAQRMMSAKDESHAIKATLFFQIAHYAIRPWPWIIVALCSLVLYPDLAANKKGYGYVMAMKDFLPAGLKGLLFVAFLAAYMSTISTQLNWGASYLVGDFYKRFIRPEKPQETNTNTSHYVMVSRAATFIIALIALGATTQMKSISGVWEFIIECGAGLGLVLILRWYWWRINAWSEISATIAPFIAYAIAKFYLKWTFPDSFFFTVSFTTISWLVMTFITKPTDESTLKAFYQKIKPDGSWEPVRKLLGVEQPKSQIGALLICWLCGIAVVYSTLFFIGSLILAEWAQMGIYAGIAIVAFLILNNISQKVNLFK